MRGLSARTLVVPGVTLSTCLPKRPEPFGMTAAATLLRNRIANRAAKPTRRLLTHRLGAQTSARTRSLPLDDSVKDKIQQECLSFVTPDHHLMPTIRRNKTRKFFLSRPALWLKTAENR